MPLSKLQKQILNKSQAWLFGCLACPRLSYLTTSHAMWPDVTSKNTLNLHGVIIDMEDAVEAHPNMRLRPHTRASSTTKQHTASM